jgi:hypothetical protein
MYDFAQRSEPVVRMSGGGMPGYKNGKDIKIYEDRIRAEALRQGVDPDLAVRMFITESGVKKDAVSPKGAAGLGQLMIPAAKEMGLTSAERFDPDKNIPASIGYLKKQLVKYNGDPEKALAAYNWGGGNVDKHLAKNEGRLNKVGLPKETADYLTKILPMGSARAEDVPQTGKPVPAQAKAAPAQTETLTEKEIEALSKPAFLTPSSGKGRKEGKLSEVIKSGEAPRQMMLAAGDLPYNLVGGVADISHDISKVFGNKSAPPSLGSRSMKDFATKYLGREPDPTDPTLKGFRTAGELGSMMVDPFSTTRKVAQTAEGLEALAQAQRAKANLAAEKTATPVSMRLEPPRTEPPVMVADPQGRVMPADTRARVEQAMADEAAVGTEAARAMALEKQAAAYPGAAQRAEMLQKAEIADKARGTALAAKVGDAETMRNLGIITERPEVGESVSGSYDTTMPKPAEKEVIDAAKEATPAKERKGFDNDDLLMLGLSLLANKSPNFMTALGEAGLATVASKKEREKTEREEAKLKGSEELQKAQAKYYGSYADAIERGAKEKDDVLLAEKAITDYMESWDKAMVNKMGSIGDPAARARVEEAYRQRIYAQKGITPIMGKQSASSAANPDPLGILGKR